jgi:hypothetical protein
VQPRIYIYVPGIDTIPGASKNWSGRAVTWTHLHTPHRAEKVEYFTTPLTRPLRDGQRARKFASTIKYYAHAGFEIHVRAHSNGCDVVLDGLRDLGWPGNVRELHLVCGACKASFEANGLNEALFHRPGLSVHVYVAKKDVPMRMAATFLGRWLGFGTLGLKGAQEVSEEVKSRVQETTWEHFGHSTCFTDEHFDRTMQDFTDYQIR